MEEGRREQQTRERWREREKCIDGRGYSLGMLQWF